MHIPQPLLNLIYLIFGAVFQVQAFVIHMFMN